MNTHLPPKKQGCVKLLGLCALFIFTAFHSAKAQQTEFIYGGTALSLAEAITGTGVQLLNPVLTCADSAYGNYTILGVPNFPSSRGIVLTTGLLGDIEGPNTSQSTTTEWDTPGDPTINAITGQVSFDGCALEFDVIPLGDTLRFNFTFASEEYREYVGTPFNDAFGFFISGPGIVGDPGLGNLSNMALIPGTNDPVEINSVNDGNPDIGFPPTNAQFFHYNPLGFSNVLQPDGWTLGLVAERVVNPCDTFRLKLVIADVSDREWDSAVFIESIESNAVTVTATTNALIENMVEACNDGTVTFTRQPVTSQPLVVTYFLQGTATNGVDYQQIGGNTDPNAPKFITIPANNASVSLDVITIGDGIPEGDESLIFYLGNPFCSNGIQDSLIFLIQDSLRVSIAPSTAFVCLGDSLTFDTETDGLSYQWSPSTFLNDPTLLEPTTTPTSNITYSLAVFAGMCSSITSAQVNVVDMILSAVVNNISCNDQGNGSINLTQTGGSSPIQYQWVGPSGFSANTEDISNLQPGVYSVLATDQNGCSKTLTVNITQPTSISVAVSSPVFNGGNNISCFQATDGQALAIPLGGTPPYTYLWSDGLAQTTANALNLPAGNFNVTVTDANGCTGMASITLTQPDLVGAALVSRTNVLCTGQNTGSIVIEAIGGVPSYSIFWNTIPPQTGATAINLAAGIYGATITDVNGCTGGIEVEIVQPDLALSGLVSTTPNACNGDNAGTAVANISGGTAPYNYSWSSAPGLNSNQIANQLAGSYVLLVTDANGCTLNIPYNIAQPAMLIVNLISAVNINCFGTSTGAITVNATGGVGPYSFLWDTNPASTGPSLSGLVAGSYTVTATDANGCEAILTVDLTQADLLEVAIQIAGNPTCFDAADGSLLANATGGTAPYSYQWNTVPPIPGAALNGLIAGTYQVTVTDANNCQVQGQVTLTAPDAILISLAVENVLCSGELTGSAEATVSGGTAPYSFLWNDPASQTTDAASGLGAGTYTLQVTDANGCQAMINGIVTEPAAPLSAVIDNFDDVICFGINEGTASVAASGGSGSYSYQWNDPAMQTSATASNLAPGAYTVTVLDNNGCPNSVVLMVTIDGPTQDIAISASISNFGGGFNLACAGDQNGTIDITLSGGTAPYTVLWNLPGLATAATEDLTGLGAGTYILTVTDFNGCTSDSSFTLTAPAPLSVLATTTPSLCFGLPEGTLSISISGGVSPYSAAWTGPNGFMSSDIMLTDLEGGVYNLQLTDANGCAYTDAVTVTQPEDLVISIDDISTYNGFNTSCSYSSDGAVEISVMGGALPYTYQWNTANNPNFSNSPAVANLGPGVYEIVVEDDNGCIQSLIIPLASPDTINIEFDASIYANGFNISCFGAMDGSIDAVVNGGVPGFDYTWTGTGGFGPTNNQNIALLDAGEYLLQVIDQNGCIAEESIVMEQPNPYSISLSSPIINGFNISCAGASDGSVDFTAIGGAAPISVSWLGPNGFTSTSLDLFNLQAGEYCVNASDANGCTETQCITLTEPDAISLLLTASFYGNGLNLNCPDSQDGQIDATPSGGVSPYLYSWTGPLNFTSTSEDIIGLLAGTYCLTVTDASGCAATECVTLIAPAPIEILADAIQAPLCNGDGNGSIAVTINGGDPAYDYSWTGPNGFAATTEDISGLIAGIYCLSILDANNCTAEACFTVMQPTPVQLTLSTSNFQGGVQIDCFGANTGSITASASGGTAPYAFAWLGPNGFTASTLSIESLIAGEYCVDVSDANGCAVSQCTTLVEPDVLENNPLITLPVCGDGNLAMVDLQTSGGTTPYAYNWSNTLTSEIVELGAGNYSVITSDANGCTLEDSVEISLPSQIDIFLSSPTTNGFNIDCNGAATGSIALQAFNASGSLTVLWSGPNGYTSNMANINGLIAGEYCVEITDNLGCIGTECITLNEPPSIDLFLNSNQTTCFGVPDGSITASISGGVPTYLISWTGPNGFSATGTAITGLEVGSYCATATDQNSCVAISCIDVSSPPTLDLSLFSPEEGGANIACFGDNSGEIVPTITGGTSPFTYSWTGPGGFASSDDNLFNLFAGTYCLTVSDANGCSINMCITLTEAAGLDIDLTATIYPNGLNTSCGGICDGMITTAITGGADPIAYSWVGPGGFTSTQPSLANLCAGVYMLTTTDGNGCQQSASIIITQPTVLMVNLQSPVFGGGNEISCFGESTGTIFSNAAGGITPYTYQWTSSEGFTSNDANLGNIPAGTYNLILTDNFGCTTSSSITLAEPDEALGLSNTVSSFPSGSNISCTGANDGSIQAMGIGGTAPYTFNWNGPNGFTATNASIASLAPGTYTVVVEDANSCVFTSIVVLTEPVLPITSSLQNLGSLPCNDSNTGSLLAEAAGGSSPYSVLWIGTGGFTATTFQIDNLPEGTYSYVVSDINGCTSSGEITLTAPEPIVVTGLITDANCLSATGAINAIATGGTAPYTYAWTNFTTGPDQVNLLPDNYGVNVIDANGCTGGAVFTVGSINTLEIEALTTDLNCNGDTSGMVDLIVITGAEPISYSWTGPDGFTASTSSISNLGAGTYQLSATDGIGCAILNNYTLDEPNGLVLQDLTSPVFSNGFNLSGFETNDGTIDAPQVSGGTPIYTYLWSSTNGYQNNDANAQLNLAAGTYALLVTDINGCSATDTIALTQPVPIEIPNGISPNGDGFNDGFTVRGLDNFPNNKLLVFNRWGNMVYEESNYRNTSPWVGTNESGEELPEGTYFVVVELTGHENLNGYLEIRR